MAEEEKDVETWQKRLEKVEQGLATLLKPAPSSGDADVPAKTPPEPIDPPKADVKPPAEPTPAEPAPARPRSLLHRAIFG